jgi:translation initiation factor 4B
VNPNQDMELPKGDAASSGKKKKQKKQKSNKTQSLNDFLARPSVGSKYSSKDPPKRTDSWADAMDERGDAEEVSTTWQGGGEFDRSKLPSAPRKAQARNIDRSRLPRAPPYTVYLGNLSYECDEADIVHFFERKNLMVKEVRLPTDSGTSRLKGFGYAELESVAAILDALELTGETLKNRSVTIDLATSKSAGGLICK